MNEFIFIDNETETYNYHLVKSDKPLEEMRNIFEEVYTKLMREFWDDNLDSWEYNDFYDELSLRLEKYWITIEEPTIFYHNSFDYGD